MKKIVHVAEVNQQRCLEESGQWLENVDQTLLVLASRKLVLHKNMKVKIHKSVLAIKLFNKRVN